MRSAEPTLLHWRAGCGRLDTGGTDCEPHPGPHTHQVYAWLLASYIFRQSAFTCAASEARAVSSHMLEQEQGQPSPSAALLQPDVLNSLRGCSPKVVLSSVSTDVACGSPFRASGWTCFEDRRGKRGWIAEAYSSSNSSGSLEPRQLVFRMRAATAGKLVVGYLRSYEGMGRASLTVSDYRQRNRSSGFMLDGLWTDQTSQVQHDVLRWSQVAPDFRLVGSYHHPMHVLVALTIPNAPLQQAGVRGGSVRLKNLHLVPLDLLPLAV